ncbi:MAG TPA: hypothetical protein PLY22_05605, partial [Fervidobacterium sp.]|nr:hypothetical protein [Fervidobacterium sp.]
GEINMTTEEDEFVYVKCRVVGRGKMAFTLQDIVDLVVVGLDDCTSEYKAKFSIFEDDTIRMIND